MLLRGARVALSRFGAFTCIDFDSVIFLCLERVAFSDIRLLFARPSFFWLLASLDLLHRSGVCFSRGYC